jgi:hypothetical protein
MNFQKYISRTVRLDGDIDVSRWLAGFGVTDDRPKDNIFGFVFVNFFCGPLRFGIMWEPQRQKQLDWQAEMAAKDADFERKLAELEQRNK